MSCLFTSASARWLRYERRLGPESMSPLSAAPPAGGGADRVVVPALITSASVPHRRALGCVPAPEPRLRHGLVCRTNGENERTARPGSPRGAVDLSRQGGRPRYLLASVGGAGTAEIAGEGIAPTCRSTQDCQTRPERRSSLIASSTIAKFARTRFNPIAKRRGLCWSLQWSNATRRRESSTPQSRRADVRCLSTIWRASSSKSCAPQKARLAAIWAMFHDAALRHPGPVATIERAFFIRPGRLPRRLPRLAEAEIIAPPVGPNRATWLWERCGVVRSCRPDALPSGPTDRAEPGVQPSRGGAQVRFIGMGPSAALEPPPGGQVCSICRWPRVVVALPVFNHGSRTGIVAAGLPTHLRLATRWDRRCVADGSPPPPACPQAANPRLRRERPTLRSAAAAWLWAGAGVRGPRRRARGRRRAG